MKRYDHLFEKICDIENSWGNLKNREDGKIIYELLIERDEVIDEYRKRISIINSDPIFKNGIVASVIHLHCNRLLGTNRELERKLMAFAESVMYAKKYIMKRTLKMALIASLAVGGSYVLYGSRNKEELSDLALSNVEALTLGTKDCMYQRNSRCYELVVGPPGEPVIIETSKEANWVNRYTIPE